jgi:hypothetical protein
MRPFFIFIFISFALFAEDRFKPVNTGVSEAKVFDSIMSNPQVKAIYDSCETTHATDPDAAAATATCFNTDLQKDQALYNSAKEQVLAAKKAKDKSEKIDVGSLEDKKKSPEIKKLEAFLSKRLEESLYEDIKGGNPNFVDADTFFSLYDTQLSKNILSATSSYCMDTNASLNFFIAKDDQLKIVRDENIKKLKEFTNQNTAYSEWSHCLKNIEVLCAGLPKEVTEVINNVTTTKQIPYQPPTCPPPTSSSPSQADLACTAQVKKTIEETTRRSCEVNNYIKSMRQNLIATKQIQDQMKKWHGVGRVRASGENVTKNSRFQTTGNRDKDFSAYQGTKEGKSFDDLTSVTTAELEKSDYNKALQDVDVKKKKCDLSTVENDPECKDIYYSKDEVKEAKKNLAEIALNLQIKRDQIKEIEKDNTKLIEFLKQEGRSQDEIDTIMKSGENKIIAIKDRIIKEADNEKMAIIASYAKIIKEKEKPTANAGGVTSAKPSAMKQLLHYNNIVSGYLEISSKGTNNQESKSGNTYILYKELRGNSGRETASSGGPKTDDEFDSATTKQKTEEFGLKEEKPGTGNAKLEVDQLNKQILNH